MKRGIVVALAFGMLCAVGCSASNRDFDSVVSGVEQRYSVHAQRIPMMGFVSLCARVTTLGGVKGMQIAQFEDVGRIDAGDLYSLMQSELGTQWQPMVVDRNSEDSNVSVIFVQPAGHSMRMLIASYEGAELDVVRMELNGARLAHWVREPDSGNSFFHHNDSHPGRTD